MVARKLPIVYIRDIDIRIICGNLFWDQAGPFPGFCHRCDHASKLLSYKT